MIPKEYKHLAHLQMTSRQNYSEYACPQWHQEPDCIEKENRFTVRLWREPGTLP